MIFKVFGGGNSDVSKTTTELSTVISNDHSKSPPRVDTWPSTSWKNHHNDDASSSGSSSDSTNIESEHDFKPNESSNKNFNNNISYSSTQRPIYVNRDNHNSNVNTNLSGGTNINKPTKKTSKFDALHPK